jgi:hypothetical protein
MVIRRKDIDGVLRTIENSDPNTFYTVEEVKETADRDFFCGRPAVGIWSGFRDMVFQKK